MPVKQLTKDEIAAIQHTITPIHRVHDISQRRTHISSDASNSKMAIKTRRESVDKWRN
jgi:hypothetical protein